MNLKTRISRIEEKCLPQTECFCNKTFVDLAYGKLGALTHCPKCKDRFDHWAEIAAEAAKMNNLADEVGQ